MLCSCRISTDKRVAQSLCHSRASCTSNVQCVHIAAGRRIQSRDANDQWRDQWKAATVCPLSDISQGSVATHFRCGGMFSDCVIANCLLILTVKKFENRLIFDKAKAYTNTVPFLGHLVHGDYTHQKTVIHTSTNRAQRWVTSLVHWCDERR